MTFPIGGIDPHQDTFTVGIVDPHGVKTCHETFDNTAAGYGAGADLLDAHGVRQVGVEGVRQMGSARRDRSVGGGVRHTRSPCVAFPGPAPFAATRQDRRRRRGRGGQRFVGRADTGTRPGTGGL